ncbi:ATP-binding protein [Anaerotalea alkaliphila]|uniref:histidine kinase n=1 Tax=Anaerotalea alkaliphila TaxID=2662126 RepID=A0A7X5HTV8_9FIRM|nr:sensor histidine kinase [Anaerotalea alkaliphila]NDL66567.1 sensor histidine kinase [Anaerotalea alkaliphila]
MKLQTKITGVFSLVLVLLFLVLAWMVFGNVRSTLHDQMGSSAMDLAVTVASMEGVQEALGTGTNQAWVQEQVESFRSQTRYQYIIVMDMEGIQYSYPYEAGLGKKYRNGGEERVLRFGEAYVSADDNALIAAIRAFAPVRHEGRQVGAVLVGLLTKQVYEENRGNRQKLEAILLLGLVAGIGISGFLAYNIKKSIYGLEPKEIALLLGQRDLILASLSRGIVAVDRQGKVILMNGMAKRTFGAEDAIGLPVENLHREFGRALLEAMEAEGKAGQREIALGMGRILLCSYCPMADPKGGLTGVVASFENLTDAKRLAEELTGYKNMVQALRAQNHEFLNRLHTIGGLVQLEEYEEVMDYILRVSEDVENVSEILSKRIRESHVAALLLAKYHKVTEAKISLQIHPESRLERIPDGISADGVCSILGNLLDNAQEALEGTSNPWIRVLVEEGREALEIRVDNNGPPIPPDLGDRIFEAGATTRGGERGMGMKIVKDLVDRAGGRIDWENPSGGGVRWSVDLPWESCWSGRCMDG